NKALNLSKNVVSVSQRLGPRTLPSHQTKLLIPPCASTSLNLALNLGFPLGPSRNSQQTQVKLSNMVHHNWPFSIFPMKLGILLKICAPTNVLLFWLLDCLVMRLILQETWSPK